MGAAADEEATTTTTTTSYRCSLSVAVSAGLAGARALTLSSPWCCWVVADSLVATTTTTEDVDEDGEDVAADGEAQAATVGAMAAGTPEAMGVTIKHALNRTKILPRFCRGRCECEPRAAVTLP